MEWQGAIIMAKIQNASASVKAQKITVETVFGKFPKIDCGNLKVADRATFSFIAGQLAVNDKTAVKLALNASGKEAVTIASLTRAFYSIYNFYQKKLKIELIECVGAEADNFYTVLISKTKEETPIETRKAEIKEVKLEASSKRAKKAQERKAQKAQEVANQAEEDVKNSAKIADEASAKKEEAKKQLEEAIKKNDTQAIKKAQALVTVEASKEYIARVSAIIRKKIPDVEASLVDTIARDIYNYSRAFKF
jgi:hypothetical protein